MLVNLTDPIRLDGRDTITNTFEPYSASRNSTDFFTFADDSITSSYNFSELLTSSVPRDYSNDLWEGDIGLVIFVYNQSVSLQYKVYSIYHLNYVIIDVMFFLLQITIDQNDLIFLAYFFVTFVM